jgi:hypothetical protein
MNKIVLGIDLDNTLACYDDLFRRAAGEERLIEPAGFAGKEQIRNAIRLLPEGESKWTRLQAIVYGPRMAGATAFEGSREFVRRCVQRRIRTLVVSHKTQFANLDGRPVDLRESALAWMKAQKFLESDGCGLSPADVFFESTRTAKVARIRALGCTHFIDDLVEVFAEPTFPAHIRKLLFAPHGPTSTRSDIEVFKNWREIDQFFFHDQ